MRPPSVYTLILAALVTIFGCGGGSAVTAPDPSSPRTITQAPVSGNVLLNGTFIGDATVVAINLATGLEADRIRTDAQGAFLLDLPAGQFGLWAAATEGSAGPQWINVPASLDALEIDLPLTAGTTGMLVGRIADTTHNEPVPNARVTFGSLTVPTDGFGFFTFTGVGANPTGTLRAEATGFDSNQLDIRTGQVDRTELLTTKFFTVRPTSTSSGSSLGGVVRNIENGNPLGGAILTLYRAADPAFQPIVRQTNLGGVWRFYNIPTGTYQLEVRRAGFLSDEVSSVINQRDGVLNLFLTADPEAFGTITGTVTDFNGITPLNNVTVVASSGVYGRVTATTNTSGSFSLADVVLNAPYALSFIPTGTRNEPVTTMVTVPPANLVITISLPEIDTGAISGRVTKTGQTTPPVGAVVEAEKVGEPQSGQVFRAYVDSNGNYGLNGLPPGNYKLKVSYDSPTGPATFSQSGATAVVKGQITKRNLTFP